MIRLNDLFLRSIDYKVYEKDENEDEMVRIENAGDYADMGGPQDEIGMHRLDSRNA